MLKKIAPRSGPPALKKPGGRRFELAHLYPLHLAHERSASFFISRSSLNSASSISIMRDYSSAVILFLLSLSISIQSAVATNECRSDVSYPIKAMLDNGNLFSACAMGSAGVRISAHSLFDVLSFSERDFLLFCRAPNCIKPVKTLLQSIPTDCLIIYHGAARNLSEEVSSLYRQCAQVVGAADKTDEDYVYRYFLD